MEMRELVIATHNKDKVREISRALEGLPAQDQSCSAGAFVDHSSFNGFGHITGST